MLLLSCRFVFFIKYALLAMKQKFKLYILLLIFPIFPVSDLLTGSSVAAMALKDISINKARKGHKKPTKSTLIMHSVQTVRGFGVWLILILT